MEFSADDLDVMARTIFGEARNQGWRGMCAVGHVILNRVNRPGWWGRGIGQVCKKPWQFSVWNHNDPNRPLLLRVRLETDAQFRECLAAAAAVVMGLVPDMTGAATHYLNPDAVKRLPDWYDETKVTIRIGDHVFLRLE